MLLSAVSALVVAQSIFEIPEGLMNNPVLLFHSSRIRILHMYRLIEKEHKDIILIFTFVNLNFFALVTVNLS